MPEDDYDEQMQGTRLRQLAKAAGYDTMAEFARAAGIKEGAADKHVQRESVPKTAAPRYIHAARGTGADMQWLLTGRGNAPAHVSAPVPNEHSVIAADTTALTLDVGPFHSVRLWTKQVGAPLSIAASDEIVPAPAEMRHSKSAFAVQVWDDINAPWCRRGSLAFVDRVRIPADGHWCLLASEAHPSGTSLLRPVLGLLEKVEDGSWVLKHTAGLTKYSVAEWPLAFLVTYIRHT